jgi:cell wall-associated NlpC family hydrolase
MYLQNGGTKPTNMRYITPVLFLILLIFMVGFRQKNSSKVVNSSEAITAISNEINTAKKDTVQNIESKQEANGFVEYAKTLIGTPYLYGSVDPRNGLDCSGFVNCVSNHFGIKVPRSSVEFTNFGTTIETNNAKPGDLILFTGTAAATHMVGHIGIVTDNTNGELQFIHSSSGKSKGVTISDLDEYYKTRFVKVIRIFPMA